MNDWLTSIGQVILSTWLFTDSVICAIWWALTGNAKFIALVLSHMYIHKLLPQSRHLTLPVFISIYDQPAQPFTTDHESVLLQTTFFLCNIGG